MNALQITPATHTTRIHHVRTRAHSRGVAPLAATPAAAPPSAEVPEQGPFAPPPSHGPAHVHRPPSQSRQQEEYTALARTRTLAHTQHRRAGADGPIAVHSAPPPSGAGGGARRTQLSALCHPEAHAPGARVEGDLVLPGHEWFPQKRLPGAEEIAVEVLLHLALRGRSRSRFSTCVGMRPPGLFEVPPGAPWCSRGIAGKGWAFGAS